MSAEGFFFCRFHYHRAAREPLCWQLIDAKWPRAQFRFPSIKRSPTSHIPSLYPYLLRWLLSLSVCLAATKALIRKSRTPRDDWAPHGRFGLFSGTQLMNFSNRAWLPFDNTDVLGPPVPSVTQSDLFSFDVIAFQIPNPHLHSTYCFP